MKPLFFYDKLLNRWHWHIFGISDKCAQFYAYSCNTLKDQKINGPFYNAFLRRFGQLNRYHEVRLYVEIPTLNELDYNRPYFGKDDQALIGAHFVLHALSESAVPAKQTSADELGYYAVSKLYSHSLGHLNRLSNSNTVCSERI